MLCAECHAVGVMEANSPNSRAPRFEAVAATPGMTAVALNAFLHTLHTSHAAMPNLVLTSDQTSGIIAYILSLKKRERIGWRRSRRGCMPLAGYAAGTKSDRDITLGRTAVGHDSVSRIDALLDAMSMIAADHPHSSGPFDANDESHVMRPHRNHAGRWPGSRTAIARE
jgi:hypothetical protein